MRFGLRKMTLLDYPGKVACTVFTDKCNFACPFCHNASLVRGEEKDMALSFDETVEFLDSRRKLLDGVCVTGGEPLLHPDIDKLLVEIKNRDLAVKVDTNGSFPARLKELVSEGLVDYVAMDIKSSPERYEVLCGRAGMLDKVRESVEYLLGGKVDYEFRTTVVAELHKAEDFIAIGKWIAGAKRYYLQSFVDSGDILSQEKFSAMDEDNLRYCLNLVREFIPGAELRGR